MTGDYDDDLTIAYAEEHVGFREQPFGSNCNPWSEEQYGVHCPGGGWCESFASACTRAGRFVYRGATYGAKGFSFTDAEIQWAQQNGLWRSPAWRAAPGDHVIFNWDGSPPTDHVEVVKFDNGNPRLDDRRLVTIGGNTGNSVAYRTRDLRFVVGFVAYSASDQAQHVDLAALEAIARLFAWEKRLQEEPLEQGTTSGDVTILTRLLKKRGFIAREWNVYNRFVRRAVAHAKRVFELDNRDGSRAGGDLADALIRRKAPQH